MVLNVSFLLGLVDGTDGVVGGGPDHVGVFAERPDVRVERLLEGIPEVGVVLGHRRHLEDKDSRLFSEAKGTSINEVMHGGGLPNA